MAEALLQRLRQKCDEKGVAGVKNLARLFRLMDADGSRNLSIGEFREGMEDYGVFLDEYELDTLFQALDSDRSGEIDVGEFIDRVRPPLTPFRRNLIGLAWHKLDPGQLGRITMLEMGEKYNYKTNEKYIRGEMTPLEVREAFFRSLDSPAAPDAVVTLEEFVNYYAGVADRIENDLYFDLLIRSEWGL
eukprot:TRINITY_DN12648_c0_g1_i2.p1 TRINITY_DN12648_c0_g1~~TRINITY_DN12648_c0_g1_i2.p1  ORF type:complete len:189 (+),score=19.48 TRINITY_DN12648_c0_g1_i2:49-615(+)